MATVTVQAPPPSGGARGGMAADYDPDAVHSSVYLPVWRPWLALYGARVRPAGQRRATEVSSCFSTTAALV